MVVRRITARACLAEPGTELERAREQADAGDASWRQWVEEYDRGQATLIDMRVTVEVELDDGAVESVAADDHQVWVHLAQHPPIVASLVADLADKDLSLLAARLRELDADVDDDELAEMHVEVELDDDLLRALRPTAAHGAGRTEPAARPGIETEPE